MSSLVNAYMLVVVQHNYLREHVLAADGFFICFKNILNTLICLSYSQFLIRFKRQKLYPSQREIVFVLPNFYFML